ncbi:hypothetical protein BJ322DRAFT_347597 [Thelephora terrestris]|uniref:Uncharacterized protein n=1 Tax=Thelephora terrestris TaxID=56493 RepID=A0A9P6H5V5_9AGAM|nr:hypothetical protein BJ322DRAFT_347597 [Thelephora terrestris]
MLIHNLAECVPVQEDAIEEVSCMLDPNAPVCNAWNAVREPLWGKGLENLESTEPVERDDAPIQDFPELPSPRSVLKVPQPALSLWLLPNDRILDRSTYHAAEESIVSNAIRHSDVFVASGTPGIGKSFFLLWLLLRRLALGLPTVLQYNESCAFLFNKDGLSAFTHLCNPDVYSALNLSRHKDGTGRIWALIDTNPKLPRPAGIFRCNSPFFIVNAVSPHSLHDDSNHPNHSGWLSKLNSKTFYMEPWSFPEILQARPFLGRGGLTEEQLWYMYSEYGASPRTLVQYATRPQEYATRLNEEVNRIPTNGLRALTLVSKSHAPSHCIVTIHPLPGDPLDYRVGFASRHVFEMVWERYIHNKIEDIKHFYDLFSPTSITAAAAGWIFELRMHQLLPTKQTIKLSAISGHSAQRNFRFDLYNQSNDPTVLDLPASDTQELNDEIAKLEENCYYRPKSTNYPAIDSLLLIQSQQSHILLMFQFTRAQKSHDANLRVLQSLDRLQLPPGTKSISRREECSMYFTFQLQPSICSRVNN